MNRIKEEITDIFQKELSEAVSNSEQVIGGLNSETYHVETENRSYILQMTSNSEPHELENCVRSFEFLQNSQVPVPETFTDGVQKHDNTHYAIVENLPGDAISTVSENSVTRESGEYLALIHNSKSFEKSGWIEWVEGEPQVLGFDGDSLKSRIRDVIEDRHEFCEKNDIFWLAEIAERFLENHIEKVPEDFEPVLVHHDFNPGNTLVNDGRITGILDFDYAHSSHAHRDLAKAANKFWLRGGTREKLYEGYKEAREIHGFEKNRDLYLLESLIDEIVSMIEHEHMTAEECEKYRDELLRLEQEL